jgi:hypothetical protein
MPRDPRTLIFVGIKKSVLALDERTGVEVWRVDLSGSDFVTVHWDGEALIAANNGEVFRLDPLSGAPMWHNGLKGLGRGPVTLASSRAPSAGSGADGAAEKKRRDQRHAAAASAGY